MTPTPRTDAAECEAFIGVSSMDSSDVQKAYDFARQLERELANTERERQTLSTDCVRASEELCKMRDQFADVRRELAEAKARIATQRAALEKAREALESCTEEFVCMDINREFYMRDHDHEKVEEALTALTAALEETK